MTFTLKVTTLGFQETFAPEATLMPLINKGLRKQKNLYKKSDLFYIGFTEQIFKEVLVIVWHKFFDVEHLNVNIK